MMSSSGSITSLKSASKTLFVGNLHASLEESDLLDIFRPFGRIVECCKRWCHYGFIQFASDDEANLAFAHLNGSKVRGRPMRIEFQRKKQIRNIQALLEAEAEAQLHHMQHLGHQQATANELLNYLQKNAATVVGDLENLNPLSYASSSLSMHSEIQQIEKSVSFDHDKVNNHNKKNYYDDEDDEICSSNNDVLEKCLLQVFEEILIEDTDHRLPKSNKSSSVLKSININSNSHFNSSSCSSPLSLKDDDLYSATSPAKINDSTHHRSSNSNTNSTSSLSGLSHKSSKSIMLFRSINSSNTIYVQPSDVIIPLSEGDYAEYKLFPNSSNDSSTISQSNNEQTCALDKILSNLNAYGDVSCKQQTLEIYSPPLSCSVSASSSQPSSNSSSLNASPISTSPLLLHRHHHHHNHNHNHNHLGRQPIKYLLK